LPSGSSGRKYSFALATRRLLSFLLKAGVLYALGYVLWLPLQGLFIRLLSAAAERVLALLEHPPIITALTAHGNSITLHSYITGVAQPLTQLHCGDLHTSIVLSLALALAVPLRSWSVRARVFGLSLALVFLVLLVVCIVQVEVAAEGYTSTRLGLTLHTAREKTLLDWALRKSSLATVFLVPAFLFLTSYLTTWSDTGSPAARESEGRSAIRARWRLLSVAAAGCLVAGLLLVPTHADRAGRVDLEGLQKIVALNPSSASAHQNLAFNLEKEGRFDEALESYRRALQLQPGLTQARFGEGNILFRKGAYAEAASCYEDVVKRQPGNMLARFNLGTTFLNLGLFDQSTRAYEEVLRANPDDAAALKNLGQALIGLDRRCDALVHLERSATLDPGLAVDASLREQIRILSSQCGPR